MRAVLIASGPSVRTCMHASQSMAQPQRRQPQESASKQRKLHSLAFPQQSTAWAVRSGKLALRRLFVRCVHARSSLTALLGSAAAGPSSQAAAFPPQLAAMFPAHAVGTAPGPSAGGFRPLGAPNQFFGTQPSLLTPSPARWVLEGVPGCACAAQLHSTAWHGTHIPRSTGARGITPFASLMTLLG